MSKFKKKPRTIEAYQWFKNGDHPEDLVGEEVIDPLTMQRYKKIEGCIVRFFRRPNLAGENKCGECGDIFHNHGWIDIKEDGHIVCPGDWIITGVKGERYPCKPDIFQETYEKVED